MKKVLKIIFLILLIAFVGIQFIPIKRNQSHDVLKTDFTQIYDVPNNIKERLQTSCYNCHSNNTVYPWYSKVQPVSWFMEQHVDEGKKELNFSEFGEYSNRRKRNKLKSITSQIKDDRMPLYSYTLIHGDAKISEKEKSELLKWIKGIKN